MCLNCTLCMKTNICGQLMEIYLSVFICRSIINLPFDVQRRVFSEPIKNLFLAFQYRSRDSYQIRIASGLGIRDQTKKSQCFGTENFNKVAFVQPLFFYEPKVFDSLGLHVNSIKSYNVRIHLNTSCDKDNRIILW